MLNQMRFRLHLLDPDPASPADPIAHDVAVMPADRMRAERHSTSVLPPSQRGTDKLKAHAETWVLLYLWCACTRLKLTAEGFEQFADRVAEYDRLTAEGTVLDEDTDPDELEVPVDPTHAEGSTPSPSASPLTSVPSSSGSTPTPTLT